jgi:hypothetical protein
LEYQSTDGEDIVYKQAALVDSLVGLSVGDHLLLRDFGPYVIIFMNVCVVLTLAMAMLSRDFGPYDHSSTVHYVHVLLFNTAQIL